MPSFRYQKGDTPLEGFTIEQAVGRGGFGEVYYAVSDAGRQVALKAVQNFEDVELRGISHVMNLKSQHLVSIFDIKHNEDNDPFVIMEFISGPSLRDVLDDTPAGMGEAKAAFFLREMAKGITYLHDCDVVHRDLKPHNVFFEDGIVKIGDYSLSKLMTMSHRTGHTMTVGSVHYMAPEISLGRYDKTVDIYALGVMLYEMLTGKPPFLGESMGEVLMRHMSGEVDVSDIAEPFASVVLKAMAKDPDERYQTADEMAGAIFGHEHIQNSVAGFAPTELSFVAGNAAKKMAAAQDDERKPPSSRKRNPRPVRPPARKNVIREVVDDSDSLDWSVGPTALGAYTFGRAVSQFFSSAAILTPKHQYSEKPDELLSQKTRRLSTGVILVAFYFLANFLSNGFWTGGFWLIGALVGGILFADRLRKKTPRKAFVLTRLATFAVTLPLVRIVDYWGGHYAEDILLVFVVPMTLLFDWKHLTDVARPNRIMMLPVVIACAAFFLIGMESSYYPEWILGGTAIVAGVMIGLQMLFPHDEKQAARCKAEYDWTGTLRNLLGDAETDGARGAAGVQPSLGVVKQQFAGGQPSAFNHDSDAFAPTLLNNPPADAPRQPELARETPGPGQPFGSTRHPERPLANAGHGHVSDVTKPQALVLAAVGLVLPVAGLHRFATGRRVSGFFWLFTFGFLTIGTLVDIVLIACGVFKDAYGRPVESWNWQNSGPTPTRAVHAITAPPTPVNSYSSIPPRFSAGGLLVSFIGLLLVTVGFIFAGVVSMDGVAILQAIPDVGNDIQEAWGSASWPATFNSVFMILAVGGMLFGGALMAIGRFRLGAPHTVRLPLGLGAIAIGWTIASEYFYRISWQDIATYIDQERIGPIVETFVNGRNIEAVFPAAMFFIAGVTLVAWPPNRQPLSLNSDSQQTTSADNPELVDQKA